MKLQSNHTILLVLEKGEDIVECITTFADDQDLTFTSVSGIGACDDVVLKFFNLIMKQYEEKHITESSELTSLLGNISRLAMVILHICMLLSVLNHMKLLADISLKQLFLQLLKSFLL